MAVLASQNLLKSNYCYSAFVCLTSAVADLLPRQTVNEFLALHAALGAAVPRDEKRDGHAAMGVLAAWCSHQ